MTGQAQTPTRKHLFQYSFIALPLAFAGLPLYVHIPDLYTRDLGMNIGLIGAILLVIRLFDAVQDPVIGYVSDRFYKQRYMIITAGFAALFVGVGAVFYGPHFAVPTAVWFAMSMICATLGFSVLAINMNMIGGFWSDNKEQRTRISAWREAFGLVGLLVASVLPALFLQNMSAESSFQNMFWVFAVLAVCGFALFSLFVQHLVADGNAVMKPVKDSADIARKFAFWKILIGPDRHFFGICFLTHIAAAMPAALVMFFIRDYLKEEEFAGAFLFLYFLSGAVLMGLWVKIAEKTGKERAWLASMILAVLTFAWSFFLNEGDAFAYGVICVLSGLALGADLALPPSILADRVSRQKNEKEATQYFALMSLMPKVTVALASGAGLLVLNMLGFVAGEDNTQAALTGVITLYALVPCVVKLCAAIYLGWLNKHEGVSNEYNERT